MIFYVAFPNCFEIELKTMKRGCRNSYRCGSESYHYETKPVCTRCRSIAFARLLPNVTHGLLRTSFFDGQTFLAPHYEPPQPRVTLSPPHYTMGLSPGGSSADSTPQFTHPPDTTLTQEDLDLISFTVSPSPSNEDDFQMPVSLHDTLATTVASVSQGDAATAAHSLLSMPFD